MRPRSTTGGSIRHREDRDLWEARYVAADGRSRSVYARSKREVQERLRAALAAADAGQRPLSGRLTVGRWLDEWLATHVEPRLRPTTVASYRYVVERHLRPALGGIPLAKLTPEDVGRMLAGLVETDLSATSQRYVLSVLRIALGRAEKSGRVARNVARLVDGPRRSTPEMRALTAEEVGVLLRSLRGRRLEPLVVTAIATGLRQGELLALRWRDLDLEHGAVTVRHTLRRGTRTLGEPKTARARRTVELPPTVVAALEAHRRQRTVRSLDP